DVEDITPLEVNDSADVLDDELPLPDDDATPLEILSELGELDADDEPAVADDDITPLEVFDEPLRKSPTVADRADMTMEFQAFPADMNGGEEEAKPPAGRATHALDSDKTIDLDKLQPPTGRS